MGNETPNDRRTTAMLTRGHYAECANLAHYIHEALMTGMKHVDEVGASDENLRDARELRSRLEALAAFVDGGKPYIDWLGLVEERVR